MTPCKSIHIPSMCLLSEIALFYLVQGVFPTSAAHSPKWTFLCLMHHPPNENCQQRPASRILIVYNDTMNQGREPSSVPGISSAYHLAARNPPHALSRQLI